MTTSEIRTNVETYLNSIKDSEFNEFHIRNHIYRTFIKPYEIEMYIKRALTVIQQPAPGSIYCSIFFYYNSVEGCDNIEITV